MKKIKILSLVIALILVANIKVFAEGGFEAMIRVPFAMSFGIVSDDIFVPTIGRKDADGSIGFSSGVTAQVGYMFNFGGLGLSLLAEFGYSHDNYGYTLSVSGVNYYDINYNLTTHSIQVGIIPKFNFEDSAFGIGGGVKIPMETRRKIKESHNNNGIYNNVNELETISFSDLSKYFSRTVIPYVKFTFEYSFFFTENMAFVLGGYLEYDIGLPTKTDEIRIDSVDLGVQLGFKFGPRIDYYVDSSF